MGMKPIDTVKQLKVRVNQLERHLVLVKAESDGYASMLLDVQRDCVEARKTGIIQGKKEQYIVDWKHEGEAIKLAKQEGTRKVVEWVKENIYWVYPNDITKFLAQLEKWEKGEK